MAFLNKLWSLLRVRQRLWLLPLLILIALLGAVPVPTGGPAAAPYVHALV